MPKFMFDLKHTVRIKCSKEVGEIIGRAEYAYGQNSYLVRYCAADGRAVETWWSEDALAVAQ